MTRRDDEPIAIAVFDRRDQAESVWAQLTEAGFAAAVLGDEPPWGTSSYRVQVARRDAPAAIAAIQRPA